MFDKKKDKPKIDKEQLELIENAQSRIKQKKHLYFHFVIFLIGAIVLIIANVVLGIGKNLKLFNVDWFVIAILAWLFLFLVHLFNVFVTNRFLNKDWEQQQIEKLVSEQQHGIEKLKGNVKKEGPQIEEDKVPIKTLASSKKDSGLTIIVAAAENDAIGKNNKLIWHLSDDLKHFKKLTSGHHLIMGRKTFESFPKPLPNRTHIVISRQSDYEVPEGVIVVDSLEKALEEVKNDKQPFIIGGGQIYKQAMLLADRIELTRVHSEFDADAFFPKIDDTIWHETNKVFHDKDDEHEYEFSFLTYVRK